MADSGKYHPTYAGLQRRISELEHELALRSGQCAQAVVALMRITCLANQIGCDPASPAQSDIDATRLRLCAESVVDMLADETGHMSHSGVLGDALETARSLLASSVPSGTSMH
jgi:hypothetical protein